MLSHEQMESALERYSQHFNPTPLVRCQEIEKHLSTPCEIYLKCEHSQPTGSFKIRGAFFAIDSLSPEEKKNGVMTRSSGNFAIALSYMGQKMGVKVHIVVPPFIPEAKKQLIALYGGIMTEYGQTHEEQMAKVKELAKQENLSIRHPYNHISMIEGSATLGMECFHSLPDMDLAIGPIGGGGLMAGFSCAIKEWTHAEVIGAEPFGARDYYLARQAGRKISFAPSTIADGLRAPEVGDIPYHYLNEFVDHVALVNDRYLYRGMKLLYETLGMKIEPSGAAALGSLLENPHYLTGKKKACVLITGSNVDKKVFDEALKSY